MTDKTRWKKWADGLRKQMMTSVTTEVTKSTTVILSETETTRPESTLRSVPFWRALQNGKKPNDVLATAGFDIEFQQDEDRIVREVTFRLNDTWMGVLERALARNRR